jgi:site-specific recombinase XerD
MPASPTLAAAFAAYLAAVQEARSPHTAKAYRQGLRIFEQALQAHAFDLEQPASALPEEAMAWLAEELKAQAPATERLYLTAASGFYEFLAAEGLADPNLPRIRQILKRRARRSGQRLPQFPREAIEKVLAYAGRLDDKPVEAAPAESAGDRAAAEQRRRVERLRNLRDRAFLLTLADTGLRVHEACKMRRGDLDWNEGKAVLVGKGDKQAVIRFSRRSLAALKDYLDARSIEDSASGKPLGSLPLFLRHDPAARRAARSQGEPAPAKGKAPARLPGPSLRPITTETGRNIVKARVEEALGPTYAGAITPHSFRHYFVTIVLRASGNLKAAQALARHSSITTTSLYAHLADDELDRAYEETFEGE